MVAATRSTWERELRAEARRQEIPWSRVLGTYAELKAQERERRERPNEVRQTAWCFHKAQTPGCWPFWRHGFTAHYGRRVDQHDYTVIPGYDELAQELADLFPEYAGDDGTERLWSFLLSPYQKLPDRQTLLRRALDVAIRQTRCPF